MSVIRDPKMDAILSGARVAMHQPPQQQGPTQEQLDAMIAERARMEEAQAAEREYQRGLHASQKQHNAAAVAIDWIARDTSITESDRQLCQKVIRSYLVSV